MNMNLLSRNKQQQEQPVPEDKPLNSETARMLDSIVNTQKKLEAAEHELGKLRQDQSVNIRQIEFLEDAHKYEREQKEWWQRHSTYLHGELSDIRNLCNHLIAKIDGALKAAEEEADRRPSTATPEQQQQVNQKVSQIDLAMPTDGWGNGEKK